MWLEMWAYVADVLGFYDERDRRTRPTSADRRPAYVAAADRRVCSATHRDPAWPRTALGGRPGRRRRRRHPASGHGLPLERVRNGEPPQVFETTSRYDHPSAQEPVEGRELQTPADGRYDGRSYRHGAPTKQTRRRAALDVPTSVPCSSNRRASGSRPASWSCSTAVSPGRPTRRSAGDPGDRHRADFEGKDPLTYIRVTLEPAVAIDRRHRPLDAAGAAADPDRDADAATSRSSRTTAGRRHLRPWRTVRAARGSFSIRGRAPSGGPDPIIVRANLGVCCRQYAFATISSVRAAAVTGHEHPPSGHVGPGAGCDRHGPPTSLAVAATELILQPPCRRPCVDNPEPS